MTPAQLKEQIVLAACRFVDADQWHRDASNAREDYEANDALTVLAKARLELGEAVRRWRRER